MTRLLALSDGDSDGLPLLIARLGLLPSPAVINSARAQVRKHGPRDCIYSPSICIDRHSIDVVIGRGLEGMQMCAFSLAQTHVSVFFSCGGRVLPLMPRIRGNKDGCPDSSSCHVLSGAG